MKWLFAVLALFFSSAMVIAIRYTIIGVPIDDEYIVLTVVMSAFMLLCICLSILFHRKDLSDARALKEHADILNKATTHQVRAKVLSKAYDMTGQTGAVYYISFEFADGFRKSFAVDVMQYNLIVESEHGLLTYKRNNEHFFFVSFQLQSHF